MSDNEEDLVIDGSNFHLYYKDVKKNGPTPGDILVRYISKAQLVAGEEKGYLIDVLLTNPIGAEMSVQIARNAFNAQEVEAIKLCKEIAKDLIEGMDKEQVLQKPYSFVMERFYWTKEKYVPKGNPHWQAIKTTFLKDTEKV